MPNQHRYSGKALSFAQPWASAVAFAGKDIENRSFRTHFRGPIAIHASNTYFDEYYDDRVRAVRGGERRTIIEWINRGHRKYSLDLVKNDLIYGHIIAIAMLVDCVKRSSSPWYCPDNSAWVLSGVVPIEPVECKGALGLWDCRFKYRPLRPVIVH